MISTGLLIQLEKEDYLIKQKHPSLPLYIYNYTPKCQFEKHWDETTLACRGLVLDEEFNIISKPFNKFFNYEELKEVPNEPYEVFEKMDGSMIEVFKYNNQIIVSSRGSFTSEQANKATELLYNKYGLGFINTIVTGWTYVLEVIYPENRICVNYEGEEKLVLLAIFDVRKNIEIPYSKMSILYKDIVDIVEKIGENLSFSSLKELNTPNKEGFVIRFQSGFRMKIKFEEYIRLHKIVTNVSVKTIWEYLKENKSIDELIKNVPDEFYKFVESTTIELNKQFESYKSMVDLTHSNIVKKLPQNYTQKEYAAKVMLEDKQIQPLLFKREKLDYAKVNEMIWKLIKPV